MTKKCPLCDEIANTRSETRIKKLVVSTAFLSQNQAYRGYSVVVYNTHETTLENLPEKNQIQFYRDMLKISSAIVKAFKPDKMNYELLGNWVPHLHWHVVPRYKTDPCWGNPIWTRPDVSLKLDGEGNRRIIEAIRKHL